MPNSALLFPACAAFKRAAIFQVLGEYSDELAGPFDVIACFLITHQRQGRQHGQKAVFRLARDYEPPVVDLAATPVRVEQWQTTRDGHDAYTYRIVGIVWGGTRPVDHLAIRIGVYQQGHRNRRRCGVDVYPMFRPAGAKHA